MEQKRQLITEKAPSPAGPYSQGILSEDFVFVSGQRPVNPETDTACEGIKEQTRQVIKNLEAVLREGGSSLEDVVRTTVYLADISDFDEMNEIYCQMMPRPFPARTTIGAQLRGILVEIDAIARKK